MNTIQEIKARLEAPEWGVEALRLNSKGGIDQGASDVQQFEARKSLSAALTALTAPWFSLGDAQQYEEMAAAFVAFLVGSATSAECVVALETASHGYRQGGRYQAVYDTQPSGHEDWGDILIGRRVDSGEAYESVTVHFSATCGRVVEFTVNRQWGMYYVPMWRAEVDFRSASRSSAYHVLDAIEASGIEYDNIKARFGESEYADNSIKVGEEVYCLPAKKIGVVVEVLDDHIGVDVGEDSDYALVEGEYRRFLAAA